VVDGKLMDKSRTCLLASIGTFCLFVEMIANKNKCGKGINELMPRFDNNVFSKSNEKECKKMTSVN
jgi:hypothetical protein